MVLHGISPPMVVQRLKYPGGNTVDPINGDNIEITQDGTDGKKITVKTKKTFTVDSWTAANTVKVGSAANLITFDGATGAVSGNTFTAGNASMNTTGFRLTGGPSVTTAGIDAGGKTNYQYDKRRYNSYECCYYW